MNESNNVIKFCCPTCNYSTNSNNSLNKHFTSKKHATNIQSPPTVITNFQCKNCNKYYKGQSGLWKHAKTCNTITTEEEVKPVTSNQEPVINQEILVEMRKMNETTKESNDRIEKLLADFIKNQQLTTATTINNNTNNNTVNNNFNMNIFLNEKCGDAINLDDFIKNLGYHRADPKLLIASYVEGTENVLKRNLEEIPINKRPLHYLVGEDPHQHL